MIRRQRAKNNSLIHDGTSRFTKYPQQWYQALKRVSVIPMLSPLKNLVHTECPNYCVRVPKRPFYGAVQMAILQDVTEVIKAHITRQSLLRLYASAGAAYTAARFVRRDSARAHKARIVPKLPLSSVALRMSWVLAGKI